ncbi:tumor necrosis factor receptor superfamily member 9a isoform X2 [Danio aesculapii]|uniref:tumor necrosis factor receptor superfamily member 9a isoform X2 n=1 Tax=Danio aesculapii TaxID=1142201 RepID=UPI0024BF73E9|nr:tumor necrosis factor receptor superfamily member 9a isoform X2 [Danio aesculapii]
MLAGFQGLYSLLIFSLVLNLTVGVDVGCQDWTPSGQVDVCCTKCKPGNHLAKRCGHDPAELCKPCEPGTYVTKTDFRCYTCTQCIGIQFVAKNCTSSSDAVCGCKPGFRCGDAKCSYCVTECKKGEEPEGRLCRQCPEGKFSDKIHSMCKEWTKSCPDGYNLKKGNFTSDSTCTSLHPAKESLPVVTNERDEMNWLPVLIAAMIAGLALLCIILSMVAYVKAQNKTKKKPKTEQDNSDDSTIMVVEQEHCSFHHPEQEQGGSSQSINTENSESKLIV